MKKNNCHTSIVICHMSHVTCHMYTLKCTPSITRSPESIDILRYESQFYAVRLSEALPEGRKSIVGRCQGSYGQCLQLRRFFSRVASLRQPMSPGVIGSNVRYSVYRETKTIYQEKIFIWGIRVS